MDAKSLEKQYEEIKNSIMFILDNELKHEKPISDTLLILSTALFNRHRSIKYGGKVEQHASD